MNLTEMHAVIDDCKYPGYFFTVTADARGATYLQAAYWEPDTVTSRMERQLTRRWFLSPEMTRSEITQTAFKCIITSHEHRVREWFKYRGNPIFGPHFNVDVLWKMCEAGSFDERKP